MSGEGLAPYITDVGVLPTATSGGEDGYGYGMKILAGSISIAFTIIIIIFAIWLSWIWFMKNTKCNDNKETYFARDQPVRGYDYQISTEAVGV